MSDEQPKNVTSVPPPTDEIDQDWGATPAPPGAGTKSAPTASEAKPVKAASKPAPATSKAKSKDEDEDEDVDDEEDEDEDEDEETGDDSEEDEEDEDDEEEEDEDEDESTASPASPPSRSAAQRTAGTASDDWLPDWAPWAVLAGLVGLGMLGGLGFISAPKLERAPGAEAQAAHEEPAAKPKVAAAAATAKPGAGDEESVEASHLLVAYQGSTRASETITRTKDEARARAAEALAKAKKGEAFDKLVGEYSDEPNAAARGGKLGTFTRTRMVKPFADAAFALKPGQLSGIVETAFGFHVILRTK